MNRNFLFVAPRRYYPMLTPPLRSGTQTQRYTCTKTQPWPFEPCQVRRGLWRFICHSNVFLWKMPAESQGTVDKLWHSERNICFFVSILLHMLRWCVRTGVGGGLGSHKVMVIEIVESFGGEMQSIWFRRKKGHPIQFALSGIRGVTGKHLKANDLIEASQASPLTHCIKAICWLLNKHIIFYPDFCVCVRVSVRLVVPGSR